MTTEIQEYSKTEAGLAELAAKYRGAKYEVTTEAGMAAAKEARDELRRLRLGLESKRVEIKAPALERCRLIDAEAKRITTAIEELEKPIAAQITAEQNKQEEKRQAAIRAEQERIAEEERQRKATEEAALAAQRQEIERQRAELLAAQRAQEEREREFRRKAEEEERARRQRAEEEERAARAKREEEERKARAEREAAEEKERAQRRAEEDAKRKAELERQRKLDGRTRLSDFWRDYHADPEFETVCVVIEQFLKLKSKRK